MIWDWVIDDHDEEGGGIRKENGEGTKKEQQRDGKVSLGITGKLGLN